MKLNLTFDEIKNFISTHWNRQIELTPVNGNTLTVSTRVKILLAKVPVSINITVENVSGGMIDLAYDGNFGVDMMVGGALSFLKSKIPEFSKAVATSAGKKVSVNLAALKRTEPIVRYLSLESLTFTPEGLILTATPNLSSPGPTPTASQSEE